MSNKYSKTQFNKDLKELTRLINEFKQGGGAKVKKSVRKKSVRKTGEVKRNI